MNALRRLSILSLILGVGQVVFGAIVRITGSGLGCGDHWPKCQGHWFPPLERTDLIIEVTHRYIAATLSVAILALLTLALLRRSTAGVSGRGGVLRAQAWPLALVITAALFGAVTVKLELGNKLVIVTHLAIAMTLLARARFRGDARRRTRCHERGRSERHRRKRGAARESPWA